MEQKVLDGLVTAAKRGCRDAHCPYSNFPVGASVLMEDGRIYAAGNVENCSFGLTMCAERNAVFKAVTSGKGDPKINTIMVYTPTELHTYPCGACLQVISEFSTCSTHFVSVCDKDREMKWHYFEEELFPYGFKGTRFDARK